MDNGTTGAAGGLLAVAHDRVRQAVAELSAAQRFYNSAFTVYAQEREVDARAALDAWIGAFDELIGQQVALLAEIDALRRQNASARRKDLASDTDLAQQRSRLIDYLAAVREGRRLAESYGSPYGL